MKISLPNPGSREAIAKGCTCPILDNNHGQGIANGTQFWISENCIIHGKEAFEILMKTKLSVPEIVEPITKKKKSIIHNIIEES